MKIVSLTLEEEKVIAKMRRDALKASAKPDAMAGEVVKAGDEAEVIQASTPDVIHCRASSASGEALGVSKSWQAGERVEFMWMPAGVSTICAGFRNGSIELTVQCDESTAQAVQASLDSWRANRPKQEPFGCIEHKEQEASFRVSASCGFKWNGDGVYLEAEPTTLGANNVNGRVHRSWSPSFTTDADYSKAAEKDGLLTFPPGVRGSQSNPAQITGVDFCVGTLTNKPAFHSMNPVKAREAEKTVTATETKEAPKTTETATLPAKPVITLESIRAKLTAQKKVAEELASKLCPKLTASQVAAKHHPDRELSIDDLLERIYARAGGNR